MAIVEKKRTSSSKITLTYRPNSGYSSEFLTPGSPYSGEIVSPFQSDDYWFKVKGDTGFDQLVPLDQFPGALRNPEVLKSVTEHLPKLL